MNLKKLACWLVMGGMALGMGGCQTAPPLSGEPPPKQGPVDVVINAVNDSLGIVDGGYHLGIETLEYVGDKTEETTEFMGDIYEGL